MKRGVGAPKGGRVHWMLFNLPRDFKMSYSLAYDYASHNYVFYRMHGKQLYDVFIVVQSSKHYWRMMYANCNKQIYDSFGYKNTRILGEKMYELYLENKEIPLIKRD